MREGATDDWSEPAKVIAFLNEIANQNTCRIGSGTLGEAFASKLPEWDLARQSVRLTADGMMVLFPLLRNNRRLAKLHINCFDEKQLLGASCTELQLLSSSGWRVPAPLLNMTDFPLLDWEPDEKPCCACCICYVGEMHGMPHIVSGHVDNCLYLWRIDSPKAVLTMQAHMGDVVSVGVLDGGRIVSGSTDKTLRIWALDKGTCELVMNGHDSHVRAVCGVEAGRVASGSSDKSARVWDLASGACVYTLEQHTGAVSAVCAAVGNRLATASNDATVRLWSLLSGTCERVLEGHVQAVNTLCMVGTQLISASALDKTIRVWTLPSGTCERVIKAPKSRCQNVRLSAVGTGHIYHAADDHTGRFYKIDTGEVEFEIEGHSGLAATPPGYFVLVCTLFACVR